eukprot:10679382-Prorocentrum_lima.AAC.1
MGSVLLQGTRVPLRCESGVQHPVCLRTTKVVPRHTILAQERQALVRVSKKENTHPTKDKYS